MISNFIPRVSNYFDSQLEPAVENKVVIGKAEFTSHRKLRPDTHAPWKRYAYNIMV